MMIINCTKKLAKRLPFELSDSPAASTTALGPWSANSFNIGRWPMVIFTNEKTLLTLAIPIKESRTLHERFLQAFEILLRSFGAAAPSIRAEMAGMTTAAFTTHTNRSTLGTMNDFVFGIRAMYQSDPQVSLNEVWLRLSSTPCAPIGFRYPRDEAMMLVAPPPSNLLWLQRN